MKHFYLPKKLPVFQPAMVNFELVDSTMQHVKKFHRVAEFELINQNGKTITHENFRGKIYIADFFLQLVRLSA
jgi:protein SCO1/2